jgi:hypothetical protein
MNISELSFNDYLLEAQRKLDLIEHYTKSDNAYNSAVNLLREIISRTIVAFELEWDDTNNFDYKQLRLDKRILDRYPFNGSDKKKSDLILEFKSNLKTDLFHMIIRKTKQ